MIQKRIPRRLFILLMPLFLVACATQNSISASIDRYNDVADKIKLGQTKEEVLEILAPVQVGLSSQHLKPDEMFYQDNKLKEIVFIRSRLFNDGITTDDEFVPYVFEDGKLVAIGWTAIGGPKTQAQVKPDDPSITVTPRVWVY